MRELDMLQNLVTLGPIDMEAVSSSLAELPLDGGVEIAVAIAQARRSLTELSFGKDWYKPRLHHAIRRLIELFDTATLGTSIGGASVRLCVVGDFE